MYFLLIRNCRMSGELMSVHVGQCGNQLGQSFWKCLMDEHAIDGRGHLTCEEAMNDKKNVFFYQADDEHFIPRAVLVDLEPRVINGIMQNSEFSNLFNKENIYMSNHGGGAGNNWASGYCQGREVYTTIMEMIEREAENSNRMDGFLFTHSVSGGTGSGMGSLILEKLRDQFPKKVIETYSVFANQGDQSDVVVHPYNSVLSLERLIEFVDNVIVLDNAALNRLATGKFKTESPTFDHINSLVTRIMSTSTAPFRFGDGIINGIRSLALSSYHPLHFIQAGFSPVVDPNQSFTRKTSVTDIITNLLKPTSMMVSTAGSTKPSHCMLAAYMLLQGNFDSNDINSVLINSRHAVNTIQRAPWDYSNPLCIFRSASSPYLKPQYKVSGLLLNNSTSIAPLFERILGQFALLRKKNAFLERFQKEDGFTVDMMDSAAENVQSMVDFYAEAEKPSFI